MQVPRFGDHVAASLGNGSTVYLTPKEARALARALNRTAREISAGVPSAQSTVGIFAAPIKGRG